MVRRLQEVTWDGGPAFGLVARYDSTRLADAFEELLVATHPRVAFVIWTGETWDKQDGSSTSLQTRRTNRFTVIASDRVLGSRAEAAVWGGGEHPGALGLKALVIDSLAGRLLANPDGIDVWPESAQPFSVEAETSESAATLGRVAVAIDLVARGGWIASTPKLGPVR